MNSVKRQLRDALLASADIVSLVGTRIYPMGNSHNRIEFPYITFTKISNNHIRHINGSTGLENPRYQVDVWSRTSKEAGELALAVRHAIEAKSKPAGAPDFRYPYIDDEAEEFEPATDGSNQGIFRVTQDFIIWAYETATPVN